MKRLSRILLRIVIVAVAITLVMFAIRFVNGLRHRTPDAPQGNPQDAAAYSLDQPGITVERVQGDYLHGFHLRPESPSSKGLVVIWGGSEGSPDFGRAVQLAREGHRVLSLFYFGQPNQPTRLSRVPLDFFDEVLAWRDAHGAAGPLTVIGGSKGAELALMLQARYPQIDNLILFTPTEYAWSGLDQSTEAPSWTWRGQDVPYVSVRHADPATMAKTFGALLVNVPLRLRETYATAAQRAPNTEQARIPLVLRGNLLAFGGDQDAMWPGDVAARALGERPGDTEAVVYPGAGHLFGPVGAYASGLELGGTRAANEAAKADSDRRVSEALQRWHG